MSRVHVLLSLKLGISLNNNKKKKCYHTAFESNNKVILNFSDPSDLSKKYCYFRTNLSTLK